MTVMTSTLARRRGRFMLALPVLTLLLCVLAVVHLGVGARTISPVSYTHLASPPVANSSGWKGCAVCWSNPLKMTTRLTSWRSAQR